MRLGGVAVGWPARGPRRRWPAARGGPFDTSFEPLSNTGVRIPGWRQGHRYGRSVGRASRDVTNRRDKLVVQLRAEGLSIREIADRLGIGKSSVHRGLTRSPDRSAPRALLPGGLCKAGLHPVTEENVIVRGGGKVRLCRPCRSASEKAKYRRSREVSPRRWEEGQ